MYRNLGLFYLRNFVATFESPTYTAPPTPPITLICNALLKNPVTRELLVNFCKGPELASNTLLGELANIC